MTIDQAKFEICKGPRLEDGSLEISVVLRADAGGDLDWIDSLHHDLDGALRSMRYLAKKAQDSYDSADPRGLKVMESIARHLETLDELKAKIVDQIFPLSR